MAYKVGCDPEVFVRNPNSGQFVSAHNMIKGDKKNPFKVPDGAVQVDGMALEFNIDPAEDAGQFVRNVKSVYNTLQGMVPGYELVNHPFVDFGEEYMKTQPEEAKELGCDPDFNAWTSLENPRPDGERSFRTAAGHIHIGWTEDMDVSDPSHFQDCIEVAKQMDWALGVPSLLWDQEDRRRSMYGNWGAFRPKPYGCEYRTLSNAWLNSEALMEHIFNTVQLAMNDLAGGHRYSNFYGDPGRSRFTRTENVNELKRMLNSAQFASMRNYWKGDVLVQKAA